LATVASQPWRYGLATKVVLRKVMGKNRMKLALTAPGFPVLSAMA
jgi:hypothetical protein